MPDTAAEGMRHEQEYVIDGRRASGASTSISKIILLHKL